ncbi:hypothetical protein Vretimale_3500 [Volvox reticuliferus]|uniref:Uncharacterized protein n=1 Tax=Volvox reticuliferus TaxID=1737510 RepID=A0A8J4G0C9_9CHLO|nr:hypothetical protein Vretifemale_1054 [Volvox reticuliferus]GIL97936.1 hypothetical protein Vretimale_3500 [Volvox reticuliferus]
MEDSETSYVLTLPISRNTRSARLKEDDRFVKGANRKASLPPTLSGDAKSPGRGLTWAEGVQDAESSERVRPFSAAAYAHSLHPLATLSAAKYAKLSDLDMHIMGAMEHKDSHRDLLAETMERMAKHNDRLKMEAVRLRAANQERAARTIQLYWRLYKEQLKEQRKREKRRTSTWMETVRRRRPPAHSGTDGDDEDDDVSDDGLGGTEQNDGVAIARPKEKKLEKPAQEDAAKDKKKIRKSSKSKPEGAPNDAAGAAGEGNGDGAGDGKKKRGSKKSKKSVAAEGDAAPRSGTADGADGSAVAAVAAADAGDASGAVKRRRRTTKKKRATKKDAEIKGVGAIGVAAVDDGIVLDADGLGVNPNLSWIELVAEQLSGGAAAGQSVDTAAPATAATGAAAAHVADQDAVCGELHINDALEADSHVEEDEEQETEEEEDEEEEAAEDDDGIYNDDEPSEEVDEPAYETLPEGQEGQEREGRATNQAQEGEEVLSEIGGELIDAGADNDTYVNADAVISAVSDGEDDGEGEREGEGKGQSDSGESMDTAVAHCSDAIEDGAAAAAAAATPAAAASNAAAGAAAKLAAGATEVAARTATRTARRHQRPERDPAAVQVQAWQPDLPEAAASQRRVPTFRGHNSAGLARSGRPDGGRGRQNSASCISASASQSLALMQLQSDARNIPSLLRIIDPTAAAVAVALVATAPSSPTAGSGAAIAAAAAAAAKLPGRVRAVSGSGYYSRPHSLSFLQILSPRLARLSPLRRIRHYIGSPPLSSSPLIVTGLKASNAYEASPLLRRARSSEPAILSDMLGGSGDGSGDDRSVAGAFSAADLLLRSMRSPRASYSLSVELSQTDRETPEMLPQGARVTDPQIALTPADIEQLLGGMMAEVSGAVGVPESSMEAVTLEDFSITGETSTRLTPRGGSVRTFGSGAAAAGGASSVSGGSCSAPASPLRGSTSIVDGGGNGRSTSMTDYFSKPSSSAVSRYNPYRTYKQPTRLRHAGSMIGEVIAPRTGSTVVAATAASTATTAATSHCSRSAASLLRPQQRQCVMATIVTPGFGDSDVVKVHSHLHGTSGGRSGVGEDASGFGLTGEASYMSLRSTRSMGPQLTAERSAPALLQGTGASSGQPFRYRADVLREVFAMAHVDPGQLLQRVMTPPRGLRGKPLATTPPGPPHHVAHHMMSPPPSQPSMQAVDLAQQLADLLRQPTQRNSRRYAQLAQQHGFPSWSFSSLTSRQPRCRTRSVAQPMRSELPSAKADCYPTTTSYGLINPTVSPPSLPPACGNVPAQAEPQALPETEVAARPEATPPLPQPEELGVVLEVGRQLVLREVERNAWSRGPSPGPGQEPRGSLTSQLSVQLGGPPRQPSDPWAPLGMGPSSGSAQLCVQGLPVLEAPRSPGAGGGARSPGGERSSLSTLSFGGGNGRGDGNGRQAGALLSVLTTTQGGGHTADGSSGVGLGSPGSGAGGGGAGIGGGDLIEGLVGLPLLPLPSSSQIGSFLLPARTRTSLHPLGAEALPQPRVGSARVILRRETPSPVPTDAAAARVEAHAEADLYRRSSEPPSVAASTLGDSCCEHAESSHGTNHPAPQSCRTHLQTQNLSRQQDPASPRTASNLTDADGVGASAGCAAASAAVAASAGNGASASYSDSEAVPRPTPVRARTYGRGPKQGGRDSDAIVTDVPTPIGPSSSGRAAPSSSLLGRGAAPWSHSTAAGGGASAASAVVGASWPPPTSSPRLEAVGSSLPWSSGNPPSPGAPTAPPHLSVRSVMGASTIGGGGTPAPPTLPAAAAWTTAHALTPQRNNSQPRRRKLSDQHSHPSGGRSGGGSVLAPGSGQGFVGIPVVGVPPDRAGRYSPYGELLGPTPWLQRVGPSSEPPASQVQSSPAPAAAAVAPAADAAGSAAGQVHGVGQAQHPTQLPQLHIVKSPGSEKRVSALEVFPAKSAARAVAAATAAAAAAVAAPAPVRDTTVPGGWPPTAQGSAVGGPCISTTEEWPQSPVAGMPPSASSSPSPAAAAMGSAFSTARYYDMPRGGEGSSRGLPNVPPPPNVATRLVVRRPAPVLRLPVVAAAQAAASHNTLQQPRGKGSPSTAAGGGSGRSISPVGLTHASTGVASNSQLAIPYANCENATVLLEGNTASSPPMLPSAGSAAVCSPSPDMPYVASQSGGDGSNVLRTTQPSPPPSYTLISEASKTSVATDTAAASAGGGGGSSRAAAREWRGLERWWQAKGLDEAVIQIHRQPVSAPRTVYL